MHTNMFQVASPRGGELVDVKLPEGYMLVLTGFTLEHVTCGIFKAAPHCVVGRAHHACQEGYNRSCMQFCFGPLLRGRYDCGMVASMFVPLRLPVDSLHA